MFKIIGTIFCGALIFLAGCATPPSMPTESISPSESGGEFSSLNWGTPTAPEKPAVQKAPAPASKKFLPVAKTNLPPVAPIVTWTSLGNWAAAHKIGKPHRISDSPVTTYAIGSGNGVMVLGIGTLGATWNGIEINLGFEPQFIDGEVFLHGLDLQKNLEPLLCEPPLTFGTNRIIVIDPGHGGSNTGTHSVLDGRFEKEFTLDWAKRLKPLLETNGWTVFLTRTNDTDVSLSNRVAFAESHHADLFVSLHFNSGAPDAKQNGLETYCITPTGMPSTLTRGFTDDWSENLPNNSFDAQNLQFAVKMHTALLRAIGMEDRGVRRARFIGVLRGQKRPAILIEAGYLSNPAEAKLIESADYRQKLAEAFANALK
ncbi:MAG TPA: N-acetylmuramoyl-L-alanine amidase [Verrucomicrobiae bacterium]